MNNELVFVLEPDVGRVTIEISKVSKDAVDELAYDLGGRVNLNCAKPYKNIRHLPVLNTQHTSSERDGLKEASIWLYRLYHNSVVDGPGRRSVVQVAGCSIRCVGCYVPQTHGREDGTLTSIRSVVREITDKRNMHDGVTILGGEPFDQAGPVAELVYRLKNLGIHTTIYSGNTIERLLESNDPNTHYILTHIDLLIDGPFMHKLAENAGEYRGSRNQRLISNSPGPTET